MEWGVGQHHRQLTYYTHLTGFIYVFASVYENFIQLMMNIGVTYYMSGNTWEHLLMAHRIRSSGTERVGYRQITATKRSSNKAQIAFDWEIRFPEGCCKDSCAIVGQLQV